MSCLPSLPVSRYDGFVSVVMSVFTLVLWGGPRRFIPGYQDGLPTVETRQGAARGEHWTSRDGRYFSVFRGIKYAKQPLGNRRFRVPEALDEDDSWTGVMDFNREMSKCYQFDLWTGLHTGREDCLNLNVYSPDLQPDSLLPVMVFIHGGGFVSGTGDSTFAGPSFFMDKDVVLVSVSYRLGVLGFLSLQTEEAPGNLGLWDQRMALLWVKKNIKSFGGDPGRVTIFGNSAGAMSVNCHLVSPQSKGLFSGAILQSGTVLSPYLNLARQPGHYADKLAVSVGCEDTEDREAVLRCLQSVPVKELQNKLYMFEDGENIMSDLGLTYPGPWLPVTDFSYTRSPFLPQSARHLLEGNKWNKVPVMLGFTSEDGLLSTSRLYRDSAYFDKFKHNWDTFGPFNILGKEVANITESDVDYVTGLLAAYSSKPVSQAGPEDLTDLFTDSMFGLSTHRLARTLVSGGHQHVYKYIFSYKGETCHNYLCLTLTWQAPPPSLT